MIKIIDEPIRTPFWSAGTKYGWEGSRTGIGLNVNYFKDLKDEDYLKVNIIISKEERPYQISVGKARRIARQYNPYFVARDKTRLVVLPLEEFECLKPISGPVDKVFDGPQLKII